MGNTLVALQEKWDYVRQLESPSFCLGLAWQETDLPCGSGGRGRQLQKRSPSRNSSPCPGHLLVSHKPTH
jgi:hypothetical protein